MYVKQLIKKRIPDENLLELLELCENINITFPIEYIFRFVKN